jgi:hypothetical protein
MIGIAEIIVSVIFIKLGFLRDFIKNIGKATKIKVEKKRSIVARPVQLPLSAICIVI